MTKILIENYSKYGTEYWFRQIVKRYDYNVIIVGANENLEIWGTEDEMNLFKITLKNLEIQFKKID